MLHLFFNISVLPIFFFFIFTLFLLKWLWVTPSPSNKKLLPPSPPKLPILGNLHQLGLQPHRTMHVLAQKHGPLMLLYFGSKPVIVASSADAAREIMKTHDLNFVNRPKSSIADRLLYDSTDVSTAPYGEYWRRMKSIYVLQLLSTKKVQSFRSVREEEVEAIMSKIQEKTSSKVNLSKMLMSYTNDVVCRVSFGRKYYDKGGKFKEVFDEFLVLLGDVNIGDFIPWLKWVEYVNGMNSKVKRVAKEFDEFLETAIEERFQITEAQKEETNVEKNFVDTLFQMQDDDTLGFPLDRVAIKALLLDTFAAGAHTSYTALEWTMTELLRHERVLNKVQKEIREITNCKRNITDLDLDKMPYLKAIIKETLRLHPPIPLLVPRQATNDVKILGYDVRGGTVAIINAWAIGRDPAIWDDPCEFKPERFLENSKTIDFKGQDFELIPFGAGRRICPGILFAMAANELLLAYLLNRFNGRLPDGQTAEDLDMTESDGFAKHRKVPLFALATLIS
jgi:cytochrome P450